MADLNFEKIENEIINKIGRDLTPSEQTLVETGISIFLRDLTISQAVEKGLKNNTQFSSLQKNETRIQKDTKSNIVHKNFDLSLPELRAAIEDKTGKGRFDLLPPRAITRLAKRFEMGANKYSDRDWEKGIQFSSLSSSALRHMFKYLKGDKDEDHLIAVAWNVLAIAEQEGLINEGKLSKEIDDIKK
jgi:hypothetical protein